MTNDESHDRQLLKRRAQFWESLPTSAYRVRRLARKERTVGLEPGEREELELLTQRIADTASSVGFVDVDAVARRLIEALRRQRAGEIPSGSIEQHCDALDALIDDMSIEVLAVGLRSLWND